MQSHDTTRTCQLETLANGPLARIERCLDCGTISLHLGAHSLRLDRTAAESLWTTLGHALGSLPQRSGDRAGFARA